MIQPVLCVILAAIAAPALAQQMPSPDGKLIANLVQTEGDWRRIDITDAKTGAVKDRLEGAAYTSIAWAPDGTGLWYSRMPPLPVGFPVGGPTTAPRGFHEVDFHRVGTPQRDDELVYFTDRFNMFHKAEITADGRWLVVTSSLGHEPRHEVVLIRQGDIAPAPWKLIRDLKNAWHFAGSRGDQFYFVTDLDAPRGRLVFIDIAATRFAVREVVPQGDDTLKSAVIKSSGIELTYATSMKTVPLEAAQ
jgi:prolyl oligopeptidase